MWTLQACFCLILEICYLYVRSNCQLLHSYLSVAVEKPGLTFNLTRELSQMLILFAGYCSNGFV